MARFELATSCSQSRRANRATLHPEFHYVKFATFPINPFGGINCVDPLCRIDCVDPLCRIDCVDPLCRIDCVDPLCRIDCVDPLCRIDCVDPKGEGFSMKKCARLSPCLLLRGSTPESKLSACFHVKVPCRHFFMLAERGGFEPPVPYRIRQFSKLLVSATHPPLRVS